MRRDISLAARGVILFAGLVLIAGAIAVTVLAFRAANAERPDPNADLAVRASERADAAADILSKEIFKIGDLLGSLAAKGAAKPGGGEAMRTALKAFDRTPGLEQLAAYGFDGKTRWVMRPAKYGRMRFPKDNDFVRRHISRPDLALRLAAPFKPTKRSGWWMPVSSVVTGSGASNSAVIVAFMRADVFMPALAHAGETAALYTDRGVLAAASPEEGAPVGDSFADAEPYRPIGQDDLPGGAYLGEALVGPSTPSMVGFRKLDCCGAVVTSISPAAAPPPPDPKPLGRWLALSAAGLMIMIALGIIARKVLYTAPDPWRDFGDDRAQPLA